MRVVVDTNVFVGACIGRGASSQVVEACIVGSLVPVMSPALFLEYEDVIARHELYRRARLSELERRALFDIFTSKVQLTKIYFRWRPNLRDEGDNHLIELALAANAEIVVTNNSRDFRGAELRFEQIKVVTPKQLIEELHL